MDDIFLLQKCVEDRLSALTDDILISILVRVDIATAARSSILSTRWRNLCAYFVISNFMPWTSLAPHAKELHATLIKQWRLWWELIADSWLLHAGNTPLKSYALSSISPATTRMTSACWLQRHWQWDGNRFRTRQRTPHTRLWCSKLRIWVDFSVPFLAFFVASQGSIYKMFGWSNGTWITFCSTAAPSSGPLQHRGLCCMEDQCATFESQSSRSLLIQVEKSRGAMPSKTRAGPLAGFVVLWGPLMFWLCPVTQGIIPRLWCNFH